MISEKITGACIKALLKTFYFKNRDWLTTAQAKGETWEKYSKILANIWDHNECRVSHLLCMLHNCLFVI